MLVRVQEFLADGNNNRRIPFPASRDKQKQTKQQEAEQDEADARADLRDILSRDEIKRNAFRIQKAKEREKLEVPCLLSVCKHAQRVRNMPPYSYLTLLPVYFAVYFCL